MPLADDLLHGADEIARFIYGGAGDERAAESNRRRVYHSADRHGLPAFKLGGTLTARRSTILAWIAQQEAVQARGTSTDTSHHDHSMTERKVRSSLPVTSMA